MTVSNHYIMDVDFLTPRCDLLRLIKVLTEIDRTPVPGVEESRPELEVRVPGLG